MPVVRCSCSQTLSVPDGGGQFRCPKCKATLALPAPAPARRFLAKTVLEPAAPSTPKQSPSRQPWQPVALVAGLCLAAGVLLGAVSMVTFAGKPVPEPAAAVQVQPVPVGEKAKPEEPVLPARFVRVSSDELYDAYSSRRDFADRAYTGKLLEITIQGTLGKDANGRTVLGGGVSRVYEARQPQWEPRFSRDFTEGWRQIQEAAMRPQEAVKSPLPGVMIYLRDVAAYVVAREPQNTFRGLCKGGFSDPETRPTLFVVVEDCQPVLEKAP